MNKTIEQVLVAYNDRAVKESPHGKTLLAIVNAHLKRPEPFTPDVHGSVVLQELYNLSDDTRAQMILNKTLGNLRGRDRYRSLIMFAGGVLALICLILAISVAINGGDADSGAVKLLGLIIDALVRILQNTL